MGAKRAIISDKAYHMETRNTEQENGNLSPCSNSMLVDRTSDVKKVPT